MCLSQNEPGGPKRCKDYIQNVENKVVAARQALDFRKGKEQVLANAENQFNKIRAMDKENLTAADQEAYQQLENNLDNQIEQLREEIPRLLEEERRLQKIATTAVRNHNDEIERAKRMDPKNNVAKQGSIDENRPYVVMSEDEFKKFQPTIKEGAQYSSRTRMVPLKLADGTVHPYLTTAETDVQFQEDRWTQALEERHERTNAEQFDNESWNAPTVKVLQAAYGLTDGGKQYIPQKNAENPEESTGNRVKSLVFAKQDFAAPLLNDPSSEVRDLHRFASQFPGDSAFSQKIRNLANQDYVSYRDAAVLASSISQWRRYKDRKEGVSTGTNGANRSTQDRRPSNTSAPQSTNEFVGVVGEDIEDTRMTVKVANKYDSDFEPGKKITMIVAQDTQGRMYKWMASNDIDTQPGDEVSLRGTVKDHSEYNGVKQTILTRGHLDVLLRK